ncbi:MAG: glutamate racemase [Synechococcaceae cyanobacterium SM1_2_3]|nr:glutamate racemase [Synechococcaceae cyanobacterium SM1_2_3]
MDYNNSPIGVFDSGVGGLSIFRLIRADLLNEHLLYVADSGYLPYGNKPIELIIGRCVAITEFFLEHRAKAVVVACNTATAAAIAHLRQRFSIPFFGVEPALKPAVAQTRSGVVGILATGNTVRSDKFTALLNRHGQHTRVLVQPCPGLADCVERGELSSQHTRALLDRYLQPLLGQGADTLVLGCTHYPFLTPLIQRLAGPDVAIIDPSPAVARRLHQQLDEKRLRADRNALGCEGYFTSGDPKLTATMIHQLMGYPVALDILPERFRPPIIPKFSGLATLDQAYRIE